MSFKLKNVGGNIKGFMGATGLKLKAASPEICLVLGLGTMAGAVVAGIIASRKHDSIIAQHEEELEAAKAEVVMEEDEDGDLVEVERDEDEIAAEVRKVYLHTGIRMAKNYALTGALMGVSAFFFCEMHHIQAGRIAGLSGAYTGLQEYIKRYEENNKKLNGEESHRMCKYGWKEVEVEEEDPDTGEIVKEKRKVVKEGEEFCEDLRRGTFHDQFIAFSKLSTPMATGRSSYDIDLCEKCEHYIRDLVNTRGWAVVNEARVMLGLPATLEGMVEGWVKGKGPEVSFNIDDPINTRALQLRNNEPIILELNVHGNVFTMLKKKELEELTMKGEIL